MANHEIEGTVIVWAGTGLFVWSLWDHRTPLGNNGFTEASGIDLLSYNPTTRQWRHVTPTPGMPTGVQSAIWTGHEIIVPAAQPWCGSCTGPAILNGHGSRYNPTTNRWRPMTHGPVDDAYPTSVWTGKALLSVNATSYNGDPNTLVLPGDAAVWDPQTDIWTALPRTNPAAGALDEATVWTGKALLTWGSLVDTTNLNQPTRTPTMTGGLRLGP